MYQEKRKIVAKDDEDRATRARDQALHDDDLAKSLKEAAGRDELHLAYQPIVTADDGRLVGLEALLRWTHPTRGVISPVTLIPIAEQSGLIVELGRWVLEGALADHRRWQGRRTDELSVWVNVSASQLLSVGFVETVAGALTDADRPSLLMLEVTESVFVRDAERALVVLNDLKELGVMLALDDFGTGFSSLSYLKRYPVDFIKVDREFVTDLGNDAASETILTSLIALGHGLGMTVVSEGVETEEQRDELSRLGCDYLQGFYLARPVSGATLEALIEPGPDGHAPHLPSP